MFRIQTILIVLLAFLPASSGQQNPAAGAPTPAEGETAVFKTGVSDVRVVVQVTENNQTLKGLTKDDFIISDNGKPQPPASFSQEKEPLNLLLLLDISGSMRIHVEEMAATARDALKFLMPGDRVAIMTFGVRANVHFDWFDNHAEIARQLSTAADDQDRDGYGTAINNAVIEAAKFITKDDDPGRHSILMVTDNLGMNYQLNDHMAIGYLLNADSTLNAIVVGRAIRPRPAKPGDNPDYTPADVFVLAEQTGGEAVKAERAAAFFPQMIERIRDRYTFAYHVPEGAKPGEFRQISVALSPAARQAHPDAQIRARSGYYVK